VYIVAVGEPAFERGFQLAESLRDQLDGLRIELNLGGGSFKSQLKRADKSGATVAVVLGEEEIARNEAGVKPLRTAEAQAQVAIDELAGDLARRLGT
jgi:histidyl-tRNA synthetase